MGERWMGNEWTDKGSIYARVDVTCANRLIGAHHFLSCSSMAADFWSSSHWSVPPLSSKITG